MEVATALLQHALDVGHIYKENAAMHHGLEKPERIVIDPIKPPPAKSPDPPAKSPDPINGIATPQPQPPAPTVAGTVAPWLMAASLATGGLGLGAAAATWLARPQTVAPVAAPANPLPAGEDHLLSDLQERGYHLSPKGGKR